MITARNYAAQAEKFINEHNWGFQFREDYESFKNYSVSHIKNAVHFAMPDNARILDDNKKGIVGREVRLPFPCITIEYHVTEDGLNDRPWALEASKRVIIARELTYDQAKAEFGNAFNLDIINDREMVWIFISCIAYIDSEKAWSPDIAGWIMPSAWDKDYGKVVPFANDNNEGDRDFFSNALNVNGYPVTLLSGLLLDMLKDKSKGVLNSGDPVNEAILDIGSEVAAVLELCEALSCSNVHHQAIEKIDPKVNERRIKKGKVPFYETRSLYIDAPNTIINSDGEHQGGTHRSPRQHLRRGHIRRLASGKNVWVNSAIVGSKENGILSKDYKVRNAETV